MTAQAQRANKVRAAVSLAALVVAGHQLVVTHGNGPQIGLIALQAAAGRIDGRYPLDLLGAESEGLIGYLFEQALRERLPPDVLVATLLTQVRVDPADPAFQQPTKPIGPVYGEAEAEPLSSERGWRVSRDGDRWRRIVASPEPLEILELGVISLLVEAGVIVICAGGGGIPVVARDGLGYSGVEAVIDKDLASALLARQLDADMLLLPTDVDAVHQDFGAPNARPIARVGADTLRTKDFAAGSMGPKVEAAKRFTTLTGRATAIGSLKDAVALVEGSAGTRVEARNGALEFRK